MTWSGRRVCWRAVVVWFVGVGAAGSGGGVARAGDGLIETRWLGAADGTWWDADRWSNGFPHNSGGSQFRAIFDAAGAPYTVIAENNPSFPVWPSVSQVVLDSDDATLLVTSRLRLFGSGGGVADVLRGTFRLGPTPNASQSLNGNANIFSRFEWVHGRSDWLGVTPSTHTITVHEGGEAVFGGPEATPIFGSTVGHTHELLHTFHNHGTTYFDKLLMTVATAFTNHVDGDVVFRSDQSIGLGSTTGSHGRFDNFGTFRLENDAQGAPITVGFQNFGDSFTVPALQMNNHGVVDVGAHTLRLMRGGDHTGVFTLDGGTLVLGGFVGGSHTFQSGSSVQGASGLVHITQPYAVTGDLTSSVDVVFAYSGDPVPDRGGALRGPGNIYTGTLDLDADLTVRSHMRFLNDVHVGGDLRIDNDATFSGALDVGGDINLSFERGDRNTRFEQGATIGGDLHIIRSGMRIDGDTIHAGGLVVAPNLFNVNMDADLSLERLHLNGTITFLKDVHVHEHMEWSGSGIANGFGTITIEETASGVFQNGSRTTTLPFVNKGDLIWNANGALRMNSPLFHNTATGVHTVNTAQTSLYYPQQFINEFRNDGLFVKTGAGDHQFLWFSPSNHAVMNNYGIVEVRDGTLHLLGGAAQLDGTSLTGGAWDVWDGAALRFAVEDDELRAEPLILTSDASVTLRGLGSLFPAFDSLAHNRGEFALLGGRAFETSGDLLNEGELTIGRGSELLVAAAFALSGDATTTFHVRRESIRGEGAPTHGTIEVVGDGALAGTLRVVLDGLAPRLGESFTLLSAAALNGTEFDELELPSLPGLAGSSRVGRFFVVEYGPGDVTLRVVPAPGAGALAALGAAAFGGRLRRVEGVDVSRRSGGLIAAYGRRRIGVERSVA